MHLGRPECRPWHPLASCEGRLEGLAHVSFLSSCLPQSENASEEAGEGEYVNLYSSGQSSEELAPSRGVSNLGRPPACGLAWRGLGPALLRPLPPHLLLLG